MFYLQLIEKSSFSNVNAICNADVQYIWIQVSHVLTTAEQNVQPALLIPLTVYFRHKMTSPVKIWILNEILKKNLKIRKITQKLT